MLRPTLVGKSYRAVRTPRPAIGSGDYVETKTSTYAPMVTVCMYKTQLAQTSPNCLLNMYLVRFPGIGRLAIKTRLELDPASDVFRLPFTMHVDSVQAHAMCS